MSEAACSPVFKELLLEGNLCDIIIRVEEAEFKAHRIVLCGCSSYFREIFCSKRSSSEQHVYTFSQVSPAIMGLILEFAYTGVVVVTNENVLDLIAGADTFSVCGVLKACWSFLEQQLCVSNCIDVWMLADVHKCLGLKQKALRFVLDHFEKVSESVRFLHIPEKQLEGLLERDELNVREESSAFEAVLRWIQHDPDRRRTHIGTLISKVRLLLMPSHYLVDVVSKSLVVRSSLVAMGTVIDAMKTLRGAELKDKQPITRPRLPSAVLLAVGGWENNSPTDRIDFYNVRTDEWETVSQNGVRSGENPRAFHGSVFLQGYIYCVGGFDAVNYLSSVQRFNLRSREWSEAGSMHTARCYVTVTTLDGCIYALGGSDGRGKLRSAERYDPDNNQWSLIAPMNEQRSISCSAALQGKLYVIGGFDGEEALCSAECYDPNTNTWRRISDMDHGCSAAQAAAYKDQIYVVGGYRGVWHLSRVLSYDPQTNQWTSRTPMMHHRSGFGLAVLEDQLFVVGGFNSHGTINNVERYDEQTDRWRAVRQMDSTRSGLSCCVVHRDACA